MLLYLLVSLPLSATVSVPFEATRGVQELTNDRLGSEADLTRLLGTLRYLHSLKVARQQVESVAAPAGSQATPDQDEASASATPGQTLKLYARQMCMLHGATAAVGICIGSFWSKLCVR